MKAGKTISIVLLFLFCALLLSACSGIGDGDTATQDSQAKPSPSNLTVPQAQAKLTEAESNLERLKAEPQSPKPSQSQIQALQKRAVQLRKAANDANSTADKMRQDSESAGHDPNDPKDAPKTQKAIQDAKAADTEASQAESQLVLAKSSGPQERLSQAQQNVDKARQDLEDAKRRAQAEALASPSSSTQASPSQMSGEVPAILATLLPFLLTTVPLLIVIGLLYRRMNQRFDELRHVLMAQLKVDHTSVSHKLDTIIGNGKTEGPEVLELRKKFAQFEGNLGEVVQQAFARQEAETARARAANIETADRGERISFPMPAEDYLSRMQGKLRFAKHDYPNRMLIEDSETGDIALVTDSAPRGMAYAVPKLNRFPTKQEYYTIYENYFECNSPYSGFVVIVKPALVAAVDGGWELREKGQLRVVG